MYSYEDRIRAVKLYSKLGKRLGDTIRQLGYPTKNSLIGWHSEYERRQDLRVGYSRSGPKYSDEQKHAPVKHYLDHDRCVASTIRALGYRSFQPQPTASKPAPAKEVASRTLACPQRKRRQRGVGGGEKADFAEVALARPCPETVPTLGGTDEKNQPRTVGFLNSGGGCGPGFNSMPLDAC